MLTIEAPLYVVKGITVFRDHEDPDLFHALPGRPALAREGDRVAFTLYKYRRDLTDNPAMDPTQAKGAGLALLEVEIPPASASLVQAEIASLTGRPDARVVPVAFTEASVRAVIARADGDSLIEDLVETHGAPLVSPHHTAFALALSAEGATLFQRAAEGGGLPVGVAYELRFPALTPSLHARVRMSFDRIYDHFSASLGFTYYVSVKLDLDIAWLVEHDFIQIEITSFTDAEDAERQRKQVMDLVTARVRGDFFRSGVPLEEDAGGGPLAALLGGATSGTKLSSASALFVLKAKAEVVKEQKDFELVYDGRTTIELTHTVAAALSTMTKDGPAPDIREIDLDDPFFSTLSLKVISAIDFDALGDLVEVTVDLARGDHRASFAITRDMPGPFTFEVPITRGDDEEIRAEVSYAFDPDRGSGPVHVRVGPLRVRSRVLVVSPFDHLRYRRVRFLLGPVDTARVPRIWVRVRVPGEDGADDLLQAELALDAGAPERVWRAHLGAASAPLRVRARSSWEDASGEKHDGDEVEITGDSHVVLGPYRDVLTVLVQPAADWAKTTQVLVEIRYRDGEHAVDRQLALVAAGGSQGRRVEIPLLDPLRRRYAFRQVILRADGTTVETDWALVDQAVLVVGAEKKTTADLQIAWVGAAGDVFGLRVDVWARTPSGEEETASAFLRAGTDKDRVMTLPLDEDGRLSYRYEVRRVSADGEELVRSGEGRSTLLVVQAGLG